MSYIETAIATADRVREAHKAGTNLRARCEYDDIQDGWRLLIIFDWSGRTWSFEGRLFRAPDRAAAETRAEHQLRRMLGRPSRIAGKLSPAFREARDALQARVKQVWEEAGGNGSDLIFPGPIKVDWNRREPSLKVMHFTAFEAVLSRYEPEYSRFREAIQAELHHK